MSTDFRFRPWHACIALPLLFALFALAPANVEAAPPSRSNSAPDRTVASKKALAKKKLAHARQSAKKKMSALGKAIKKHHKHPHRHHKHKHHHKHKKHHTHKRTSANAPNAGIEKHLQQDLARLERDEKSLTRDTNRLRRALK
jgi:hypothetical protein